MKYDEIIEKIARGHNTTAAAIESEMKNAIHAAKDNPYFKDLFRGKVPTAEEFVWSVTDIIRKTHN